VDDPTVAGRDVRGRRVVVFACGEMERGDDAAALRAVNLLRDAGDERMEVRPIGALEPEHLLELGDRPCVVADCVAGIAPGDVVVRSLEGLLPGAGPPGRSSGGGAVPVARSTHLLPIGDVLALAEIVRPGLPRGTFVGIGGADFGLGRPLSPDVERALPAFAEAIAAAAAGLLRPEG
jgi:hydrogenase maturation protease